MIQFSEQQIVSFRQSPYRGSVVSLLRDSLEDFMAHDILVPERGISNWSHYFYCPDCSVMLKLNLDSPHSHECPICHRHFSDELKDGAWWRLVNGFNETSCQNAGRLYLLTGETVEARKAIEVLKRYATFYKGYEIHGDIPYNGPGKLNAQTLDEANYIRNMAYAYDLLEGAMTEDERDFIKENLFRPALHFLKEHRHPQIHNHEVIINGAMGVVSLLLGDYEMLDFSLNAKYGIRYQLEHGVLDDGYWFECSTAYHFYALQSFLFYERFARHTPYSNLDSDVYPKMIASVLRFQRDDLQFPLINDCHLHQGEPNGYNLFEFAYSVWRSPELLNILHHLYEGKERLSIESFFYGVEELPPRPSIPPKGCVKGDGGLGMSMIRRGDDVLYFRHGPYGGEHDHYDRLGISHYHKDIPVSIDLGTTGYGAPLHYAYYKKTNTHNTVVLNGGNQAPSEGKLLEWKEKDDMVLCKAEVEWTDDYEMPDSFWILQWDDKSYRHVKMTRTVAVTDEGIIDRFEVSGAADGTVIDINQHFHGKEISSPLTRGKTVLGTEEPYSLFEDSELLEHSPVAHSAYDNEGIVTDYFYSLENADGIRSKGYDNPSNRKMSYITRRTVGKEALFYSFISSGRSDRVVDVSFDGDDVTVKTESGIVRKYNLA